MRNSGFGFLCAWFTFSRITAVPAVSVGRVAKFAREPRTNSMHAERTGGTPVIRDRTETGLVFSLSFPDQYNAAMPTRLMEIMDQLPASRIVLVGDLMMDRYLYGNAERLSPEAPVPVLHYRREELRLGGAGGVAADLAALGAQIDVIGVIGKDETGQLLRRHLRDCGTSVDRIIEAEDRPTTSKVRLVGLAQHRHPQQMMRLDYEEHAPLSPDVSDRIVEQVEDALNGAAMLCIEDYNKGLLHADVCPRLIKLARAKGVPVIIDPANIPDFSKYAGSTRRRAEPD